MNSSAAGVALQVGTLLDAATPAARLTDGQLRDRVVECERAIAMLQATQAEAMVQMGARAPAADRAETAATGVSVWSRQCREQFVTDEIGVLLGCTKMAAAVRYGTACQAAAIPVVQQAWRRGLLDARKVATICEHLGHLDGDRGEALAAAAVNYATEPGRCRTGPQLREWLRRRVIAADPAAAEVRRQRAMGDRRVVITPADDGMSELWALLPGVQARQIQQALTTTAQQLGAEDARSMDQRRTDTLVDLLLGRAEPVSVDVQVIVPADTLTGAGIGGGAGDQPGWVPGLGPVTPSQLTELIGDGGQTVVFRRLVTDPTTGVLTDLAEDRYRPSAALDRAVRARDVTCRFPGCRRTADSTGTDLDHTVPYPTGPTSAANLAVLCRRHHRLKHTAGWTVTLGPTGMMTWTTPTGHTCQTEPWHHTDPGAERDPDPPPDG